MAKEMVELAPPIRRVRRATRHEINGQTKAIEVRHNPGDSHHRPFSPVQPVGIGRDPTDQEMGDGAHRGVGFGPAMDAGRLKN